jgi:membrane dipeptidase
MPEGIEDVSCYPALFEELATRGYRDEDLMKIAGGNVLRVMREVERIGTRLRTERPASNATIEELDRA